MPVLLSVLCRLKTFSPLRRKVRKGRQVKKRCLPLAAWISGSLLSCLFSVFFRVIPWRCFFFSSPPSSTLSRAIVNFIPRLRHLRVGGGPVFLLPAHFDSVSFRAKCFCFCIPAPADLHPPLDRNKRNHPSRIRLRKTFIHLDRHIQRIDGYTFLVHQDSISAIIYSCLVHS